MYKEETMKVLDLLSKGLIDSKTAETLLQALDNKKENKTEVVISEKSNSFKVLKIKIESAEGDDVNIKIPLEFAKLLKNKNFSGSLNNTNVDIDEIIELASSGIVGEIINIDSAEGDSVKITIE